jgi:hypothetical protein
MYAPAIDFLSALGILSNFSGLPDQLVINGQIAPTSLLGIGPERYTGTNIYYLDVTGTLSFLKINYILDGWKITVQSPQATPAVVTVPTATAFPKATPTCEPVKGSITINCNITHNIDKTRGRGVIRLLEQDSKNNIIRDQNISRGSTNYYFSDLLPGEYKIEVDYYYNEKGPLEKDPNSEGYYFDFSSHRVNMSHFITLKNGENFYYQVINQDLIKTFIQSGKKYTRYPYEYDNY